MKLTTVRLKLMNHSNKNPMINVSTTTSIYFVIVNRIVLNTFKKTPPVLEHYIKSK